MPLEKRVCWAFFFWCVFKIAILRGGFSFFWLVCVCLFFLQLVVIYVPS